MKSDLRVVTVVQARTGSGRLPNKVLLSLAGKPLLLRMLERVKHARLIGTLVVATTTNPDDTIIAEMCEREGYLVYRGSENDLLDRHYQAARELQADAVVKIPSDCPLIDAGVIDQVIEFYLDAASRYDYVSNLHPATFPDGNDVEIMSMSALHLAWQQADKALEREHTTPFFWENPDRFRIGNIEWKVAENYSMTHRWTIDYIEDYCFIKAVYDELFIRHPFFSMYDILNLLEVKPYIKKLNDKYAGVNWYRHHLTELKTILPSQTKII